MTDKAQHEIEMVEQIMLRVLGRRPYNADSDLAHGAAVEIVALLRAPALLSRVEDSER